MYHSLWLKRSKKKRKKKYIYWDDSVSYFIFSSFEYLLFNTSLLYYNLSYEGNNNNLLTQLPYLLFFYIYSSSLLLHPLFSVLPSCLLLKQLLMSTFSIILLPMLSSVLERLFNSLLMTCLMVMMVMIESMLICTLTVEGKTFYYNNHTFCILICLLCRFVKTIRSWWGEDLDDNDHFAFSWRIDNNIKAGRYFIEMYSEDDDDDDDVSRSFMFEVAPPPAPKRTRPVPARQPARGVRQPTRGTARRASAVRKDRLCLQSVAI